MVSDTDAELKRLAQSDGWAAARVPIVREIVDLMDITKLPLGDERALAIEVAARQAAAKILQGFLNRIDAAKDEPDETFAREKEAEVSHVTVRS